MQLSQELFGHTQGIISDWRIVAVYPLLLFIDFILSIPAFAQVSFWLTIGLEESFT